MPSAQPASSPIRVLVAENSVINAELLSQAVARDKHMRVVEVSTTRSEVLYGAAHANPDVLLISDTLGQCAGGGLEVLSEIRTTRPDIKAVVLLDTSSREAVVKAFRAGAKGVFCRNQPVKMLCKCIAMVGQGQIWATSAELNFLTEAVATGPHLPMEHNALLGALSDRERDVVRCLAEGLSNRDIAVRLKISQHTVKNYMFRIFEKLGVSSRLELLFFVLRRTGRAPEAIEATGIESEPRQLLTRKERLDQAKVTTITSGTNSQRKEPELTPSRSHVASGLGSA